MGNPEQSSRVAAAIDWYGPTDFLLMDEQTIRLGIELWEGGHSAAASPESKLMGGQITRLPEKCRAANPVTYVTADHAPVYVQHGTQDNIVPYLQSVLLVEKLKALKGKNEVVFELIENAGHANPAFFTLDNINKMLDFLDRYLR